MKQIVDKLNEIARAIDESVELSDSDLIIDSLDSITKAYGGTPSDSNLIVDKLDDIANCVHGGEGGGGITPTGTISITTNGTVDVTNYRSANVNVPTSASWNKQITIKNELVDTNNGSLDIDYLSPSGVLQSVRIAKNSSKVIETNTTTYDGDTVPAMFFRITSSAYVDITATNASVEIGRTAATVLVYVRGRGTTAPIVTVGESDPV